MYKLCIRFYKDFMEFTHMLTFRVNVNLKFPKILGSTIDTDLCQTSCSILNCRIKLFISWYTMGWL